MTIIIAMAVQNDMEYSEILPHESILDSRAGFIIQFLFSVQFHAFHLFPTECVARCWQYKNDTALKQYSVLKCADISILYFCQNGK